MVRETRLDLNPSSLTKRNHVIVKFVISLLLMGLAFRLFISDSFPFSPFQDTQTPPDSLPLSLVQDTLTPPLLPTQPDSPPPVSSFPIQPPISVDLQANHTPQYGKQPPISSFAFLFISVYSMQVGLEIAK